MSMSFRHEIRDAATDRLIASASCVQRGRRAGQWRIERYPLGSPYLYRFYAGSFSEAMRELMKCALDQERDLIAPP